MTKKKESKDNKQEEKAQKPKVNPELEGFDIEIDPFGEIKSNYKIERINEFLNRNVEDKKLLEREDYDEIKEKGKFSKEKKQEKKDN